MHSDFSFVSAELHELPCGYGFVLEKKKNTAMARVACTISVLKYKYWFKTVFSSYTSRHNRISTQTMRNHLRRFTLCARQQCQGPILNRQRCATRLHWVMVQRLSFLNLPHTGLPKIKCSPYTDIASILTVLYPSKYGRWTSLVARNGHMTHLHKPWCSYAW